MWPLSLGVPIYTMGGAHHLLPKVQSEKLTIITYPALRLRWTDSRYLPDSLSPCKGTCPWMHLSDRETEFQGSSHQQMPHSPVLPWIACFVDPGWTLGRVPPALLIALGHLSLRWPATVASRASVGSGSPGIGTWQVGERSTLSWPRQERTYRRSHLGWHPEGRRLSGPPRMSSGTMASLSHVCC